MISKVKEIRKHFILPALILSMLLTACSLEAQIFKKKNKNKEKKQDRSVYAYQTYSTTIKKEKKRSFSGEAKFHFEKPIIPVPFGKIDREVDYSKGPYFGHKRIPVKRSPGNQKLCKVCGIMH